MTSSVFVTGMARSGTTLLDKLLSLHPNAFVASQPLPLLYVWVKRAFWESSPSNSSPETITIQYPLNDMFGEHYYPLEELLSFLRSYTLTDRSVASPLGSDDSLRRPIHKTGGPFPGAKGLSLLIILRLCNALLRHARCSSLSRHRFQGNDMRRIHSLFRGMWREGCDTDP